ncbi:BZ3500_MvSof-1268-A1-R1_Chr8-2g10275 [Microbotryum saponariae]|uniref:BZ3500_MvSof-1268-A1-R1_Chr8-2g10275 protein n=1 Tax=Microbotryum saponariae TaxID=289078 RepID=A0A2X0KXD4_9BASI|nr:BZ3500_MvSof-1268-A1-R1_Chr8-2g10275 [Microbotryum saponariae]SDA02073.1 BZ3501_MvSof-1269-A2-R1_Chr8-2g10025 [Microbotryum saponariae]
MRFTPLLVATVFGIVVSTAAKNPINPAMAPPLPTQNLEKLARNCSACDDRCKGKPAKSSQTDVLTRAACLSKCLTDGTLPHDQCPIQAEYNECLDKNSQKQLS